MKLSALVAVVVMQVCSAAPAAVEVRGKDVENGLYNSHWQYYKRDGNVAVIQ
ncbi:hypothetical protein MY4824_009747 [Beauveria thailandica]